VLEFLEALQASIACKLLTVWYRLQAHRSRLDRQDVEEQRRASMWKRQCPKTPGRCEA